MEIEFREDTKDKVNLKSSFGSETRYIGTYFPLTGKKMGLLMLGRCRVGRVWSEWKKGEE